MRISSLAMIALVSISSTAHAQIWRDAATGKAVGSGPNIPEADTSAETGVTRRGIEVDPGDPNHAFDPVTGRNFFFDRKTCLWKDSSTGKAVGSGPNIPEPDVSAETGVTRRGVDVDPNDPNRAFDPVSGRNFVRTACPAGKAKIPEPPPPKTDEHASAVPAKPDDCQVAGGFKACTDERQGKATAKPSVQTGVTSPAVTSFETMTIALPARVVPNDAALKAKIGELYTILKLINDDRARYGVPPLKWDDQLAHHAQEWADQLARMGRMEHAPREGRGIERENLAQGMPWWSIERLVQEWRGEEKNYVPGKFPNVALDGNWEKVAHWTQDISRLSQEIGCAIAKGSGFIWLDCRFSPGGNKDGEVFGPAAAAVAVQDTGPIAPDRIEEGPHDKYLEAYGMPGALKGGARPVPPPAPTPPPPAPPAPPPPDQGNPPPAEVREPAGWPEVVGNVRIDQGWGSQAIMAAVHTINSPPPPVSYEPATIYVDTKVEPPPLPFSDELLPRDPSALEPM